MPEDQATRDRVRALVRDVLRQDSPTKPHGWCRLPAQSRGSLIPPHRSPPIASPVARDESSKMVITEDDVRGLESRRSAADCRRRAVDAAGCRPRSREQRIEIVRRQARRGSQTARLIAVGCDHGGFKMKEDLKALLSELGHRVHDFGIEFRGGSRLSRLCLCGCASGKRKNSRTGNRYRRRRGRQRHDGE